MNKVLISSILSLFLISCGANNSTSIEATKDTNTTTSQSIQDKTWYTPNANTSWQWQLTGTVNTSYDVKVYDIDLFDTTPQLIKEIHDKGKKVICYFSGGSFEDWREDANKFPVELLGKDLDGWEGEKWLDIRDKKLQSIMNSRLDLAKEKGCDGVEPDNMDGYTNKSGFKLSSEDQLKYNIFMANSAHERGLSIGLKNDLDQTTKLEPYFDFSINEECHEYNECENLTVFVDANKPVFNAEYASKYKNNPKQICTKSLSLGIQTLILPLDLDDSFRISCE